MCDNRKDDLKEIRKIEDKYGLVLFRMGLSHLVDVGHRHLDIARLEECFEQISAEDEANKASGVTPIMTADFQREIVRCAAELAIYGSEQAAIDSYNARVFIHTDAENNK